MKQAVALGYEQKQNTAPKVLASGKGTIAEKIINKAKEFDVPIFVNKELVASLVELEIDKEIPQELYSAVVDVFVWLNSIEKRLQS